MKMAVFNDQSATGCFKHVETKNWFEFRPTDFEWAINQGLTHEIAVAFGGKRYCRFSKKMTRAYVLIDEDVIETWPIQLEWVKE